MSELRGNNFGYNKVAVPIGTAIEGNRIWMHLRQPKRAQPEIIINPEQDFKNNCTLNFRNSKYFNQLKKNMKNHIK